MWKVSFGPTEHRTHGRGACDHPLLGWLCHERDRATPNEISRPSVLVGGWSLRGWGLCQDPGAPWGVEGVVPVAAPELGSQTRLSHARFLPWLCLPSPGKAREQRWVLSLQSSLRHAGGRTQVFGFITRGVFPPSAVGFCLHQDYFSKNCRDIVSLFIESDG